MRPHSPGACIFVSINPSALMESTRLSTINRGSLFVSLSLLAFVFACGSDKASDAQDETSSDSTSSSAAASSGVSSTGSSSGATTSQSSSHATSTTTRDSDETSDDEDTSNESSEEQDTTSETMTSSSSQSTGSGSSANPTSSDDQGTDSESDASDTSESDATSSTDGSSSGTELSAYERLCSTCHGPTGDGVDGLGPDIKHPVEDYSEWVIRNGRTDTTMVAFDAEALSDDELSEILEFLASQEQPTTGEGLYVDYCAACHGDDGTGGPTTRPIVNEAQEAEELVRNGHGSNAFSNRREYMPKWSDTEISDAELDLIIAYIESL